MGTRGAMFRTSLVQASIFALALGQALAQASTTASPATTAAPSGSGSSADPSDDCKLDNDFKYEVCSDDSSYFYDGSSYSKGKGCCSTRQTCVGSVTIKNGGEDIDAYQCSDSRKLIGMKFMKVAIIPFVFLVLFIVLVVIMIVKLDLMGNHLTKAAVVLIFFTWPLLLSQIWWHGVWTAFLAVVVAFLSNCSGVPWWVYRLAWAMQIFQLVLLLGPTEAFHVPIFNQSLAGSSTKLIGQAFGLSTAGNEASCDQFYEGFFKKVYIELSEKESNPDETYYGLCAIGWLAYIQFCLLAQSIMLIAMAFLSAPKFLDGALGGKTTAAVAVSPAPKSSGDVSGSGNPDAVVPMQPVIVAPALDKPMDKPEPDETAVEEVP